MASTIDIQLTLDQSQFINAMKQADRAADKFVGEVKEGIKEVGSSFSIARAAAASFIGGFAVDAVQAGLRAMVSTIGDVVNAAANVETIVNQFTTLTGSVENAEQHVRDLQQFAATTPFQLQGLAESSKILQSFGFQSESVIPILQNLGDIAAISGNDVKDLAIIFGQVSAAGKLTGERLLQLQERGIPVLKALADNFDTTEAAVREMVTKGQVSFQDFQKSMSGLNAEGAQFFNGMTKLSETFGGKLSTLKDNFELLAATAGKSLLPIAKNLIDIALKILPGVTKATGDFMQTALPGFQVLSDLLVVFTQDVGRAGKGIGSASEIGTTFSDVVLSIGKGIIFAKTGFEGLFEILRAGTAAVVLPLVASLRGLATAMDIIPGVDLSKEIQALDKDLLELSKEVTDVGGRLKKLGESSAQQIKFLEEQNVKTKQMIESQKQLKLIEESLIIEKNKGAAADSKVIEMLKQKQVEISKTIASQQNSIKTTALEAVTVQEAEIKKQEALIATKDVKTEVEQAIFDLETVLSEAKLTRIENEKNQEIAIAEAKESEELSILKQGLGNKEAAKVLAEAKRLANQRKNNEAIKLVNDSLAKANENILKKELEVEKQILDEKKKGQEEWNKEKARLDRERAKETARQEQGSLNIFKQLRTQEVKFSKMTEQEKLSTIQSGFAAISSLRSSENKTAFAIGKAAAIADATIRTYQAATGAFAALSPIPIVGPGLAAAAAASITAAGLINVNRIRSQQAPRFQDGGIVPGSSFTGDQVTARLNSSEMVLNRGQQQNLFNQINSGNFGGGNQRLEKRIESLEKAIMTQPIIVSIDGTEIARATRDAEQGGFQ